MALLAILSPHRVQHHLLQAQIRMPMDLARHHQGLKVMKRRLVPLRQRLDQIQNQKRDRVHLQPMGRVKPKSSALVLQQVQTRRKSWARHQPMERAMQKNLGLVLKQVQTQRKS